MYAYCIAFCPGVTGNSLVAVDVAAVHLFGTELVVLGHAHQHVLIRVGLTGELHHGDTGETRGRPAGQYDWSGCTVGGTWPLLTKGIGALLEPLLMANILTFHT